MIHADRETVYAALFTLLKQVNDMLPDELKIVTTGRKLLPWTDVPEPNQPAMFLKQGPQEAIQGGPLKHTGSIFSTGATTWVWTCSVWVYFRLDAQNLQNQPVPDVFINKYLDAFEDLILGPNQRGGLQTLAGVNDNVPLVYNCWIDGNVSFDDGLLDNQAVIVIPISILVGV